MTQGPTDLPPDPLSRLGKTLLGVYLVLLPIILAVLAIVIWPIIPAPSAPGSPPQPTYSALARWLNTTIPLDLTLILLVIISGAIGSYIHSATSFADFVGNRRIASSWVWWYILRGLIGLSLALIFYFVLRGGLLSAGTPADNISPFGIAAVSGLVGMFSKQATDKLQEVFDTLFRSDRPVDRADKLSNPVPKITDIDPRTHVVSSGDLTLLVTGNGFISESVGRVDGRDRRTTYRSPTELRVVIPAADLPPVGNINVTVYNPPPGGGVSDPVILIMQ